MDLLGIILFILFIVAKSFGDSKKQKAKRQQRTHPLEKQPWDTIFQQQTEQPGQKELVEKHSPADKDDNGVFGAEQIPGKKVAEHQSPYKEQVIQLRERQSAPKARQKRIGRPEVNSVTEIRQPKAKKSSKLAVEDFFDEKNIVSAFILSEVLQPPKALKQTRR